MSTHQAEFDTTAQRRTTIFDSSRYRTYVLAVLVLGYVFNTIDRNVFGIVTPDLQLELGLTDSDLGWLGGPAFALFYAFMGIPIARLADRWNRVNVLSIAVALWCGATAACGAVTGFFTLLLARIGVAVGEAGGSPPSHSIISDLYGIKQRATALSIYAMAVPFGSFLGNMGSGWINQFTDWRWTFVIIGAPGLLVALLMKLTLKEPPRGYSDGPNAKPASKAPPILEVFSTLTQRKAFVHMSLAAALHSVVWYSGSQWNRTYLLRAHELDSGWAGTFIGVALLIGTIGTLAGGYLADRLSRERGDARWIPWVPGIACAIMVPFQFLAYLHTNFWFGVVPSFIIMVVLASMFFGPSFTMAQSLATVRMRAVSTSLLLFVQTLIGYGMGPLIVGYVSDYLAPIVSTTPVIDGDPRIANPQLIGNPSLQYALVIVGLCNLWAAWHYFLAGQTIREDMAETARLNAAGAES